jgi:hypothetical protein
VRKAINNQGKMKKTPSATENKSRTGDRQAFRGIDGRRVKKKRESKKKDKITKCCRTDKATQSHHV